MAQRIVKPIIDKAIQKLCFRPYYNHKNGCPNFNKAKGCPPNAPLLGKVLDLNKTVWAVWVDFDFAEHKARMLKLHTEWIDKPRVVECCRYWQGAADKLLKHYVANFCTPRLLFSQAKRLDVLYRPEAYGVNVTETMKNIGVILEWPPVNIVRKIAFIGEQSETEDGD